MANRITGNAHRLFLLPEGEGQDEGGRKPQTNSVLTTVLTPALSSEEREHPPAAAMNGGPGHRHQAAGGVGAGGTGSGVSPGLAAYTTPHSRAWRRRADGSLWR